MSADKIPRPVARLLTEERPDADARWAAAIGVLLTAARRCDQDREIETGQERRPA